MLNSFCKKFLDIHFKEKWNKAAPLSLKLHKIRSKTWKLLFWCTYNHILVDCVKIIHKPNALLQMFGITLWLLVGEFEWDFTFCSITCPDGNICSDFNTCCETRHGYSCCPYQNVSGTNANIRQLVPMIGFALLCMSRLCAAPTWPTAALQLSVVTWPPRCVIKKKKTSHGWRRRLQKNQAFVFYLYLPFRYLKTIPAQTRKRIHLPAVTCFTFVLIILRATDTHEVSGFVAHTFWWVAPHINMQ